MFVDFKMSIYVSIEYNYTLYRKGLTRIPGSSCEARESLEVQEEEPEVHSAVEIGGHQDIQRHFAVKENTLY